MKRSLILSLLILLFCFSFVVSISAQTSLETLYRSHNFFELRDEIKRIAGDFEFNESQSPPLIKQDKTLFYVGAVYNKFNRPLISIKILQAFLKDANKQTDAKMMSDAYEILSDDYVKTYEYAKAADALKTLTTDFRSVLEADEIKDHENDYELYNALRGVPAQTISFAGDSQIQATRDKAKLLNVPVEVNSQKMNFVFDTGANLSTMTVSTAQKLGLKIIEANFDVGSMTKERVKSKLAVAPELHIGKMTWRNVVFLVFDDAALSFPSINYKIDGIIGFPVIEAMRQITLTRQDLLTVPARPAKKTSVQNLALDGLSPLVQGTFNNTKMTFIIDTGAQSSTFHPPFFASQKERIIKNYQPQKTDIGGAGGAQQVDSYMLKNVSLDIGGKTAHFPQISLINEVINDQTKNFYGNLGQDLIKQFDKMTLDFEQMSIIFE